MGKKWGGKERKRREVKKGAKEERTASFNISCPYPVTVFNRKSTLLVTRCAISCSLHRSSIFFSSPPSPDCRMQLSMLYIRGTSIFSTYGHVHTYTYISLLRRHSTPLLRIKRNAMRDTAPPVGVASTRYIHRFRSSLRPSGCFNFSKLFFFPPSLFFPLKFSFLFALVKTVDLLDRLGFAVNKRICFIGVESATSSRYDLQF